MITIHFQPWSRFRAEKDRAAIRRWLKGIGEAGEKAFKTMGHYPPASSPSEYPAIRSGALRASIGHEVTDDTVTIGSDAPEGGGGASYSLYLRHGTTKMRRRKMSDNALREGMQGARLGKWVQWTRY